MIKILAIGNSFSQDALRYLHGMMRSAKIDCKVVNLYIGGCSLYRHYRNMLSEERAYSFEINGMSTGLFVSLKEALLSDEWDFVSLQESSPKTGSYECYEPYIGALADYVRLHCPPAKLLIHKTWTFAEGCPRFKLSPFETPEEMFPAITECYERAAKEIGAEMIIPSGDAMYRLYREIGDETYRDGFHANKVHTRYMLGLVWFASLTGRSIDEVTFRDLDGEISDEMFETVRRIAKEVTE